MYYEWIVAALGVIVAYMLLGLLWAWWKERRGQNGKHRK